MIEWPKNIIEDTARRKVVLFLGSGISKNSVGRDGTTRPATWEEFLRHALGELTGDTSFIEKLLTEKDYLTACEIIMARLGSHRFFEIANNCFLTPRFEPHGIHQAIFNLDARIVATPNVDKIYDTFANQVSNGTIKVKYYYDNDIADKIRSKEMLIIKVHGTIERESEMIFTRKKYTEARYKHAAFYQILNALSITHTFIFLGCGLSDPDIKLILEDYAFTYPGSRPHYMVTSADDVNADFKQSVKENWNLELITYNPAENHVELFNSLQQLVTLVEEERTVLSETRTW